VGTITEIELTRVLERVTATYNLGLASGILYIKRRAHVSYSHMHQLLWAANSKIYFAEWVQKKESPTTSSTSSTAWSAESTTTTLSNLNVIVGDALHSRQHRFARRHHLLLAAEYGSSEAQSQLGIDLLIPSPIPSEVIVKKGEYFLSERESVQSRIWKSTCSVDISITSPSFKLVAFVLCHVSPSILKTPKQVFF